MARTRRKKSIIDLERQVRRISSYAQRKGILDRVEGALNRYANNIQRSKQWKDAFEQGKRERLSSYDYTPNSENTFGYGRADSLKVDRNVYMGLSNG